MTYRKIAVAAVTAALLSACGDATLDYRNAEVSNGKVYARSEDKPFTGSLTDFPQSLIKRTDDLTGFLAGLAATLDRLKRTDESIRFLQLVCNGATDDGYLHGEVSCYEPGTSTLRYQVHYKQGQMNGDLTIWGRHDNVLAKASFQDDRLEGQYQYLGPNNGRLITQGHARAGLLDGLQQRWDETTGQLTYQATAEKGFYVGVAEGWTPSGQKISEIPYQNGQINGVVRAWDGNTGRLIREAVYKDNSPDGPTKEWYENGELKISGEYRNHLFYPTLAPADNKQTDACIANYVEEFHMQAGEDAPVNSEQLDEWENWCQQRKIAN